VKKTDCKTEDFQQWVELQEIKLNHLPKGCRNVMGFHFENSNFKAVKAWNFKAWVAREIKSNQ
jgi:hypothetical protein